MSKGIVIKSVGVYHPSQIVDNEFYIEHYKKMDEELGVRVSHLLEHLGRNKRFIAEFPEENVLTMAKEACEEALERAEMSIEEVDGIIFSTDTPEYTSPSNAIVLRDMLGATNAHVTYDLNANCVGMIVAVDQGRGLMLINSRIKRLLVVGSSMIHHYGVSSDPVTYASVGDGAAAVILENISLQSDERKGFLDSLYSTKTDLGLHILMPQCGMSNIYNPNLLEEEKRWLWKPFDTEEAEQRCGLMIKQILEDNKLSLKDTKMIFMTQFSKAALKNVSSGLNYPMENMMYIGDKYGYTGTSSPFIALYHALLEKRVQSGDTIVFWSAGSGLTTTALLYRIY
jgi:3-oxoacyl-[acyl-carrier-protein] synthase-3